MNVYLAKVLYGKPHFDNNTVQYIDHNQNFTKVNKAYTIQVTSDDPDEKCETGQHIRKIFPTQTNAIITETNQTGCPYCRKIIFSRVELQVQSTLIHLATVSM